MAINRVTGFGRVSGYMWASLDTKSRIKNRGNCFDLVAYVDFILKKCVSMAEICYRIDINHTFYKECTYHFVDVLEQTK